MPRSSLHSSRSGEAVRKMEEQDQRSESWDDNIYLKGGAGVRRQSGVGETRATNEDAVDLLFIPQQIE